MASLLSLLYLGEVAVLGLLWRFIAPKLGREARPVVLSMLSGVILWQFFFLDKYWQYLAAYMIIAITIALIIFHTRFKYVSLGIVVFVLVMLVFKYPNYTAFLSSDSKWLRSFSAIEWIGLSYTTFRALDMLIQVKSSRTKSFYPQDVVAYLLFFSPFVSGPINRFLPFVKDMDKPPAFPVHQEIQEILLRISIGVVKLVLLSRLAWYYALPSLPADFEGVSKPELILAFYAYFAYIYWEFSGYSDIVIAIGRLWGIKIPENFEHPYKAKNIQDFWSSWHISLSQWCRDHVFYRLMRYFASDKPEIPNIAASAISIIVTFLFIGAWHGDSVNWIFYGLYQGSGLAFYMLWRHFLTRIAPEFQERLDNSKAWEIVSIFLTQNYIALGLLLTFPWEKAKDILLRLWA